MAVGLRLGSFRINMGWGALGMRELGSFRVIRPDRSPARRDKLWEIRIWKFLARNVMRRLRRHGL